jgi:RimJ/RimL family protein N-acetyltransferase
MDYKCLQINIFHLDTYSIKPIDHKEIEQIRIWRNSQMDVLRQKNSISVEQQIGYFDKHIWQLFEEAQPNQLLFSFYKADEFIGYGGLVHISWEDQRAEMSFLVNPSYTQLNDLYAELLSSFISLLKKVVFDDLNFHKLFTETYAHRTFHISILEKNGFILDGVLRDHVIINGKFTNSLMHSILKNV